MPVRVGCSGCYWLLEGHGDGGAEQLEDAALDGCRGGDLLDSLPTEIDDLPVQGGEVVEQVFVAVER